jgi:type II secretory pathway pseudopilin PulG
MIELLLVIVIVGILAVAGVSMLGNRTGSGVRQVLDSVEGSLAEAHKASVATGRDTALISWGNWTAANPLVLAYGDASLTTAQIQTTANGLLANPPVLPSPTTLPYSQTVAVPFFYQQADRTESTAHIALAGSGDWGTAMLPTPAGKQNQDITTVAPFLAGQPFNGMVVDANNLCTGALPNQGFLISGFTQRFNTAFIVEVVATVGNGVVLAGGAMGLIVVQANGNSIYKFYNPGILYGDGKWRKI